MIDIFGQAGSGEQIAREGDKGEGSLVGLLFFAICQPKSGRKLPGLWVCGKGRRVHISVSRAGDEAVFF